MAAGRGGWEGGEEKKKKKKEWRAGGTEEEKKKANFSTSHPHLSPIPPPSQPSYPEKKVTHTVPRLSPYPQPRGVLMSGGAEKKKRAVGEEETEKKRKEKWGCGKKGEKVEMCGGKRERKRKKKVEMCVWGIKGLGMKVRRKGRDRGWANHPPPEKFRWEAGEREGGSADIDKFFLFLF